MRCNGMKMIPLFTVVAAIAFAGCDSHDEKARKADLENRADSLEDQAKATKKNADRAADATEDTKKNVDRSAEAIRIEGERKAAGLKEAAKETREQK